MIRILITVVIGIASCLCINGQEKTLYISEPISELEYADRNDIEVLEFTDNCIVTEIPDYAFLGCSSLRKVVLPKGLKKIGFQAFSGCSALLEIYLPSSLEDIGSNAFAYCSELKEITFPDSLKHIGHNAFSFCSSLRSVWLPNSITELESYAFSDCASLKSARLPANSNLLGELIFNCCNSLEVLIAPSPEVPVFDCNSFIFDPLDTAAYQRCVLKVPGDALNRYRASESWNLFKTIIAKPNK